MVWNQRLSKFVTYSQLWTQIQFSIPPQVEHTSSHQRYELKHLICLLWDFAWQRILLFKLFQKLIILSDSKMRLEPWSQRSQRGNTITSCFECLQLHWSYSTLHKQHERPYMDSWWLRDRRDGNLSLNLSLL